jgi:hypothetical protein
LSPRSSKTCSRRKLIGPLLPSHRKGRP